MFKNRINFKNLFLLLLQLYSFKKIDCANVPHFNNYDINMRAESGLSEEAGALVNNLYDYYDRHGINKAKINNLIFACLKGAAYNRIVRNSNSIDDEAIKNLKEKYDEVVLYLLWFYYAMALHKEQPFTAGTFTLIDPDFKIYNFLRENPKSYKRISTHFKKYAKFVGKPGLLDNQFGLDIPKLPADSSTLLFGEIDEERNLFFVKPETHGVEGYQDLVMHGLSTVPSFARKMAAPVYYELKKSIQLKPFADYLEHYLPTDDDLNYRKERIPLTIINKYIRILRELKEIKFYPDGQTYEDLLTLYAKEAVALGMQRIYKRLNELKAFFSYLGESAIISEDGSTFDLGGFNITLTYALNLKESIKSLKNEIETYDNINFRFGREVILTSKELDLVFSDDDTRVVMELEENLKAEASIKQMQDLENSFVVVNSAENHA